LTIREVGLRVPVQAKAIKRFNGIRVIPSVVGKRPEQQQVEKEQGQVEGTAAEQTLNAVTSALTLLAKGIEGLSEQNRTILMNNTHLQNIIAQLAQPKTASKLTKFTVTHRDEHGNIAGFVAQEADSDDIVSSEEIPQGDMNG
jgi:hypothetical protein